MNTTISQDKGLSKKEARQLIYNKLTEAMVEFKPLIKQKKFETNLQKITKLFTSDLTKASRRMKMEKPTTKKVKNQKEKKQEEQ